ncbi:hypothetical protein PG994_005312 [Apiospora phragmitis]|uniref:Rhodopsin domain-containing protein n=1 Tax=Apiospora phragmitis TaxID=2905665 RepID=A0ABR1VBW7_9PEZI
MDAEAMYYADVPLGQVRTPVNPPTRQGELVGAGITTILIAGVAVSLRLYTRIRVMKTGLSPDDWLVTVAMAMSILMTIFVKKDIDHGLTYHVWDILQSTYRIGERLVSFFSPTSRSRSKNVSTDTLPPQYGLLAYLTFILSVSFAKMSMLVFYTRLAPQNWVRAAAYGGVFAVVCYSLTAIFVESLGCWPIRGIVDETLSDVDGGCDGSYPGTSPVCVVAIYRVRYIPTLEASEDYDWDAVPDMILCFLEVNAGIVCASVPALRPFFTRYFPALISSRGKRSSGGDDGNGRTIDTVEQRNAERQMLKQRRNNLMPQGSGSSHEMFPVADPGIRHHPALQQDDEEAQLWIPGHASKDSGAATGTDGSSRT